MSEQWYWKHDRDLLGPLDTEALERLIRQHRIADRDHVRLATDDQWLTGAAVKTLFANGGLSSSSSEAAARLLSQSARLRDGESAGADPDNVDRARRRLAIAIQHAAAPLSGLLDHLSDLCGWGFKLTAPLLNRYVLLTVVAIALSVIVAINIHVGSDARNRRIYFGLSQAWTEWEGMQSRSAAQAELQAFHEQQRPNLDRQLQTLIDDGKRSPGRSADSFSWLDTTERGWQTAHTRKALIQAIQAFQSLTALPTEAVAASPARDIFQQNMLVARDLLDGSLSRRMAAPRQPSPAGEDASLRPMVLGFLILDALLIGAGLWHWRRRMR